MDWSLYTKINRLVETYTVDLQEKMGIPDDAPKGWKPAPRISPQFPAILLSFCLANPENEMNHSRFFSLKGESRGELVRQFLRREYAFEAHF